MKITLGIIFLILAVGGYFLIGSPIEKTDTSKSIEHKTIDNIKTDVLEKTSKQVTSNLSEQAIDTSCKDPNSTACSTTKTVTLELGVIMSVFFTILGLAGVAYLIKIGGSALNYFQNPF